MMQATATVSTIESTEESNVTAWRADPDVQSMLRAKDGDLEAFESLFRKHSRLVVKFAFQFVHSQQRAEDIAQMVFLQLYRARHRYEPRARFLTYLYRITTNTCLNELRRREYSTVIESLDAVPEHGEGSSIEATTADNLAPDPHDEVSGHELATEIYQALDRLPPNQRAAFLLGRIEGLPYSEVAESLDTSVSAVKSLIFRATSTMRHELREYVSELEPEPARLVA